MFLQFKAKIAEEKMFTMNKNDAYQVKHCQYKYFPLF